MATTKDVNNKKNGKVAEPETKATNTEETVEAEVEKKPKKKASTRKKKEKKEENTTEVEKVEAEVAETPIDDDEVDIDDKKITRVMQEGAEESVILSMSDEALQNYINNAIGYNDEDYDNDDAEDFDDEADIDGEMGSVDFYQSSSNKKELDEVEIINTLKTFKNQKNVLMAKVIGQKTKIIRSEHAALEVMCAECKFINKPFDKLTVYIPFDYFYAETERGFMRKMVDSISSGRKRKDNPDIDKKLREYEEVGNKVGALEVVQGSYIRNYLFAQVPLIIQAIDSDGTIIGSRAEALKRREQAFFNKGRYVQGIKKIPEKGSVIHNCNITLVEDKFVRADICGIPTNIRLEEISWPFISSCKEVCKIGDQIDVKILSITGINETGKRHIKASIKRVTEDTTQPALNELRRDIKRAGKFRFLCDTTGTVKRVKKNLDQFGYIIYTDKTYNAIALHHNFNRDAAKNTRTFSEDTIPVVGSKVVFHPLIVTPYAAIGTIADVIKP